MKKFYSTFCFFIFLVNVCFSQDSLYARKVINTLCSPAFHGRGYVNDGDSIAANYLRVEFQKIGLLKFTEDYYQKFSFPINVLLTQKRTSKSIKAQSV